jgi:hypothetical protein
MARRKGESTRAQGRHGLSIVKVAKAVGVRTVAKLKDEMEANS